MRRTSSDEVSASVLDSPSAVLSGPSNASNLIDATARAELTTQLPKYLLIGGVVLAAVFLVSKFGKK